MEVVPTPTVDPQAIGLYATWGKRSGAWLIDAVVVSAAIVLLDRMHIGGLGLLLIWPVYFTLCHGGERGQTIGKRVVGIAVRDAASLGRLSYPRSLARWLVTALFWVLFVIPGILDGLSPLWKSERRAWHDVMVGSVVIRVE
jgi:uncharacterized RDD family membrane protein YckC